MAISNGYLTLAELRAAFLASGITSTAADSRYEEAIEEASRMIDGATHRRFYGAAETRYYTAEDGYELAVDDLTAVTSLKTDENSDGTYETTWTAGTDYNLAPYNASLRGRPYTRIETTPNGSKTFPVATAKAVQIVGTFGFVSSTSANCPKPIKKACEILAIRYLMRRDTPLGVAGNPSLGEQRVIIPEGIADPDVKNLLAPYVKYFAFAW